MNNRNNLECLPVVSSEQTNPLTAIGVTLIAISNVLKEREKRKNSKSKDYKNNR